MGECQIIGKPRGETIKRKIRKAPTLKPGMKLGRPSTFPRKRGFMALREATIGPH